MCFCPCYMRPCVRVSIFGCLGQNVISIWLITWQRGGHRSNLFQMMCVSNFTLKYVLYNNLAKIVTLIHRGVPHLFTKLFFLSLSCKYNTMLNVGSMWIALQNSRLACPCSKLIIGTISWKIARLTSPVLWLMRCVLADGFVNVSKIMWFWHMQDTEIARIFVKKHSLVNAFN